MDPIGPMAEHAREFGSWLHVDGAYGLFGRLDARVKALYEGLEGADSVVVDPHKWLATPVGIGAAFVRDRSLLGRAFTLEPAAYLEGAVEGQVEASSPFDSFGELFHDFNLDQSAPSRGAVVWAVLREIGAEGMRQRVRRHNDFARRLAELVAADERLELLATPTLSICCFRYRAPDSDEARSTGSTPRSRAAGAPRLHTSPPPRGWQAGSPSGRAISTRAPHWPRSTAWPGRCGNSAIGS